MLISSDLVSLSNRMFVGFGTRLIFMKRNVAHYASRVKYSLYLFCATSLFWYYVLMNLRNSISIRFSEEIRKDLEKIADETSLTSADLVRLAVQEYIRNVRTTGNINIPLKIEKKGNGK